MCHWPTEFREIHALLAFCAWGWISVQWVRSKQVLSVPKRWWIINLTSVAGRELMGNNCCTGWWITQVLCVCVCVRACAHNLGNSIHLFEQFWIPINFTVKHIRSESVSTKWIYETWSQGLRLGYMEACVCVVVLFCFLHTQAPAWEFNSLYSKYIYVGTSCWAPWLSWCQVNCFSILYFYLVGIILHFSRIEAGNSTLLMCNVFRRTVSFSRQLKRAGIWFLWTLTGCQTPTWSWNWSQTLGVRANRRQRPSSAASTRPGTRPLNCETTYSVFFIYIISFLYPKVLTVVLTVGPSCFYLCFWALIQCFKRN